MISGIIGLLSALITIYIYTLIAAAIFSMLTAFGVVDTRNRLVWTIGDFLYRVTEPVLRPIRNMLPSFGGVDISPLIAILLLELVQMLLGRLLISIEIGSIRPIVF